MSKPVKYVFSRTEYEQLSQERDEFERQLKITVEQLVETRLEADRLKKEADRYRTASLGMFDPVRVGQVVAQLQMERDEARALADQMHDSVAHFMHERDEARALARWYGQRLNEQGGMPRKEFNDAKFRYPWLEFPGWLEERR